MLAVSSKWAPALTTDHGLSVKINVLYNGAIVAEDIGFVDGTVKVDRGSDTRRSLSLTIDDPSQFPVGATDRFGVYGQRIYAECGVTYMDGSSERVPVGTFVITSISGDIHTGPLTIAASGLELLLKRALWDTAQSTATWATPADFMAFHIPDTIPGATFVNASTNGAGVLAARTWDAQTDKMTALSEVAASIGAELFCDANGTFRLVDIPDPADLTVAPVWNVSVGESGVMVSAVMELASDGVFNRVVASGENAGDNAAPVSAEAKITSTSDPLRYGGPFGKVTKSYASSLITTTAQAQAAANAMLVKYKAANRTVALETIPNPALDAGDRIRVIYGPAHTPEIHIVNAFDIPLSVTEGSFAISTVSGKADV